MDSNQEDIIHINITNFAAAVAIAQNPSLSDTAFVIAKAVGARNVVLSLSQRAAEEGIVTGMPVAMAIRMAPSLTIVPPETVAGGRAEREILAIVSRFSPTIQQEPGGHVYIDVAGTSRLFGPPIDCAVRMRNEIQANLGMKPAVAVASNKLVAKIGTRAIRPSGIAQVRSGHEAAFLSMQDIRLLPGVGPSIGKLLAVAGFQEIGELASLSDQQVIALLGKRGVRLRDAARGWDSTPVDSRSLDTRTVQRDIEFSEPVLAAEELRAAIVSAAEDAGLAMRSELLACFAIRTVIRWADGSSSEGTWKSRHPLLFDEQIIEGAWNALIQAMRRRIRIRCIQLSLLRLAPAQREPDLFSPPGTSREERLQAAVDATRRRFGASAITHATAALHA